MTVRLFGAFLATALLASAGGPALAHHSVGGEFNVTQTLTLNGVVSGVEWANPHIYVLLAAKDAAGTVTQWRLESVPVGMMRKAGQSKALLLADGQAASVTAYPARDGTPHLGYLVKITYADGHHYQFASDK
ncbi:MAG: DUF6152 family protein [Steroidobacteraceae bacterium]